MYQVDTPLLLIWILLPLAGAVGIALCRNRPNLRESVTLLTSTLLAVLVCLALPDVISGARPEWLLASFLPGLDLKLSLEPLGLLFAVVASCLWIVTSVYAIGYMRGNNEKHQTRFYICFAVAISGAMGIAAAGNLLTLFFFYEMLTLSTYPLVAHKGDAKARAGARMYLGILLTTSIGFLLPAIVWTWSLADTVDFRPGGILAGTASPGTISLLFALFLFGTGKAALMPFHRWLPSAMVAPTPVSALLHAVAVVKAGVFTVTKIAVYVFGTDLLANTDAATPMLWVAMFTLLGASCVAMTRDNLKSRLAYSTISQLAYVVAGACLASSMGIMGAAMQIPMHAVGKITLFFCAGAIYTAAHKTEISDMDGLGRVMPVTYIAFLIGALSIIGIPPLGGSWSKWYLMLGALQAEQLVLIVVLAISSLLNIAYLLPIVARGFFRPLPDEPAIRVTATGEPMPRRAMQEAPVAMLVPLSLTALGCALLFFHADIVLNLITPILDTGADTVLTAGAHP